MLWCDSVAPFGDPVVPDVLDVDRIVELQLRLTCAQIRRGGAAAVLNEVGPRDSARCGLAAKVDHMLAGRDRLGLERTRARHRQLRHQRRQHLDVVRLAETACRHENADTGLIERVFELAQSVGRVDIDEDRANLRRRVLHDRPLRGVRAPDPDPVSSLDPKRQQRARRTVHLLQQVGVGVAEILMAGDQRVAIPEPGSGTVERRANRFAEK